MWDVVGEQVDPAQVAQVVALARSAAPSCGATVVVAIDGRSGAGKTTLAAEVASALACPTVHMDQLYPGWEGLAEAVDLLTTHVLEPVARGERAAYPVWDWDRGTWGRAVEVSPGAYLVVEGCGSSVGSAGRYAAVRVWLDAHLTVRRRRGLARDGEAFAPWWEAWAGQEDALFSADRTRERADLVLDTGSGRG